MKNENVMCFSIITETNVCVSVCVSLDCLKSCSKYLIFMYCQWWEINTDLIVVMCQIPARTVLTDGNCSDTTLWDPTTALMHPGKPLHGFHLVRFPWFQHKRRTIFHLSIFENLFTIERQMYFLHFIEWSCKHQTSTCAIQNTSFCFFTSVNNWSTCDIQSQAFQDIVC